MGDRFLAMGLDLSTNHAAAVVLDTDGTMVKQGLVVKEKMTTPMKGLSPGRGHFPSFRQSASTSSFSSLRLF